MNVEWKYEVGAVLAHRATLLGTPSPGAVKLYVVSRLAEEDAAGPRLAYRCRSVGLSAIGEQFLDEAELIPWAEYAAGAPTVSAQEAARLLRGGDAS